MRILIVEDEGPAARQLEKLLREARTDTEVLAVLDSVESAADWLRRQPSPDLILLDIQLADGLSFDLFSRVPVQAPVIFTTAFDQYALRAFKLNSVDYLLKPVDPEELESALQKYERLYQQQIVYDPRLIEQLRRSIAQPAYKERFLVKAGQYLTYLQVYEIRYFYSEHGLLFARTGEGKKHNLDYTLDQLEERLDPTRFFRVSRKVILSPEAIRRIAPYFNSRLILDIHPDPEFEVIVSRDRVTPFKEWLDR